MSTNNLTQTLFEDAALLFASSNNNQLLVADGGSAILNYTFTVTNGVLVLGSTLGVTFTGNNSGTVTVAGTSAAINAAINGLVYSPTANYFGASALTVLNGAAVVMTVSLSVGADNDAPVITLQSTSQTFNEDNAVVFNSANANAITVADVDSTALTTSVTANEGKLTLGSTSSGARAGQAEGAVAAAASYAVHRQESGWAVNVRDGQRAAGGERGVGLGQTDSAGTADDSGRSEERRVGKECSS